MRPFKKPWTEIVEQSSHFPLTFVSRPRGCNHFLSLPYLSSMGMWEGEL